MKKESDHSEMLRLMEKNAQLIHENNKLLKKLYKQSLIVLVIRLFWYAVLIGLPFALYFYVLEPYFSAFGSDYNVFIKGLGELPGLKGLEQILP